MRTPEQVKWDFVQQWLSKAHKDLLAAAVLLEADLGDYEHVGFHAQQAAEKYIKAFLVRHQIEFPKTHDIAVLRQLVGQVDPQTAERLAKAEILTPYGVTFRYPGALTHVAWEEGERGLQRAREVRDAVLEHLKSYLEAGRPGS